MHDANFTAPALNRDVEAIRSPGQSFDGRVGARRLDHADAEALASPTAR